MSLYPKKKAAPPAAPRDLFNGGPDERLPEAAPATDGEANARARDAGEATPPPEGRTDGEHPVEATRDVEDGIHAGIDFPSYFAWPRMHHSDLVVFGRSAAHAREAMKHPPAPTPALELGHAVHVAVLEPARFAATFVCGPTIDGRRPDRRTTIGKAAWERAETEAAGRELLDPDDWRDVVGMRDAVWEHPFARRILAGRGVNEVGLAWTDPARGVRLKGRLDRFAELPDGWPAVVDLKTTTDGSRREFERAIASYKYHQQAALYVDGAFTLSPVHRRFVFVVVEKTPPYAVAVYELEDDTLDQGRYEYGRNLDLFLECSKTDEWPGYSNDLVPVSLPSWALTIRE